MNKDFDTCIHPSHVGYARKWDCAPGSGSDFYIEFCIKIALGTIDGIVDVLMSYFGVW